MNLPSPFKLSLPHQVILTCWLGCASAATAQTVVNPGQLFAIEKQGKVEFRAAEASNAADTASAVVVPPNTIMPGGTISTAANGSATVVISGVGTAQMGRNTEVRLPSETGGHSLELLKGKLFLQIQAEDLQKRQAGEFRLKTPSSLLAVKGTRFFVDCDKKSETVGLHEGAVLVTEPVSKGTASLLPGQAVTVSAGSISAPGPLSAKDKNDRPYDAITLERTPLLVTLDSRYASGAKATPTPIQYFHEGRLLQTAPGVLTDWEFLRFHNFDSTYRYENGRRIESDKVRPLSITPKGEVLLATTYIYPAPATKYVKGKRVNAPPVLGDLTKRFHADLHFKGRAWRSKNVGQTDVGPLLGLQMHLRLKNVGRASFSINTYPSASTATSTLEAPAGLPASGVWESDCVVPVTLDKSGEDSRYSLHINIYPEGPFDAEGKLRSGTAEIAISGCGLISRGP